MAIRGNQDPKRFDISAAVVFRLGEELITDVVQALVELVKNSYDADATWVKVTVDTNAKNEWGRKYSDAVGVIRVEDDGDGMDEPTIVRGWLTIASSKKREDKAKGRVSRRGRTPIGDKGLGRLGVQRLARNVEIFTRPRAKDTEYDQDTVYYVAFSWQDFRETANLSQVPIDFTQSASKSRTPGTTLVLSGLRSPEAWRGDTYLQDLQRKLSGMISPFQEVRDFVVYLEIDGKRIELTEIAQGLRDTALLRYRFMFDGIALHISGIARLDYLQPSKKEDQALLRSICRKDRGRALFEFLKEKEGKRRPSVFHQSEDARWFVEFGGTKKLEDMDKVRFTNGALANPGPFRGEVDAVSWDQSDLGSHVIDRKSDYRRLVRDLAGVRVYRDGFGIRVGEDWLGLGKQWTRGSSYYGLRPDNVLGYVALTARDNQSLLETTSREGFQATPHYENFYDLLTHFVKFSGEAQEFLRRGVLEFLKEHRDRSADVKPEDAHPDITLRIEEVARFLSTEKSKLDRQTNSLRKVAEKAAKTFTEVRDDLGDAMVTDESVSCAFSRLDEALAEVLATSAEAEKLLVSAGAALERASELKSLKEVLDRRWDSLQDEVGSMYESISLGLTAEALSHEIHNIADGLARRSTGLLREIKMSGVRKASVVTYVEHVRTSVAGMRKQLGHLTPSLRYLREKREHIKMSDFLKELASFYNSKLTAKRISIDVRIECGQGFAVQMNKGKLTQIFDNLVLNSEYWLDEAMRAGHIEKGEILIEVDTPVVRVMDNGRGVEPGVEETLFEPFVTTKRSGQGRGLGLFVVQQLLDSESCTFLLLPERNTRGRRYVFEIDLAGAISG